MIGANFEARPNVVVDIASQFVKSRNAGVLRTGLGRDPFGHRAGRPGHRARARPGRARPGDDPAGPRARAGLGPGAGQPARPDPAGHPARQRGQHPVAGRRGGPARGADHGPRRRRRGAVPGRGRRRRPGRAARSRPAWTGSACATGSTCCWSTRPGGTRCCRGSAELLGRLGIAVSLPPHAHPLGHEWALDTGHEATVTIAPADGPRAAAMIANEETSGLAAAIVTADQAAAAEFLGAYAGHRRVLERHHPPARRVQAAVRARRPGSTSTPCPAPAARSPSATCTSAST